jgi:hypothetical protein
MKNEKEFRRGSSLKEYDHVYDRDYKPPYYGRYHYNAVESDLWDSGWVTLEEHFLFVPRAIVNVCNSIQDKFPGLEWAILLKGEWTKYGFVIGYEYAVPRQEVSAGNVAFNEEDNEKFKLEGFNVILHSHHNMGIKFSGSDHTTLTDSSLLASLLFSKGEIGEATLSIKVAEGVRVAIVPKITVMEDEAKVPDQVFQAITRKTYTYTAPTYNIKDGKNPCLGCEKTLLNIDACDDCKAWDEAHGIPKIAEPPRPIYIRQDDGTYTDEAGMVVPSNGVPISNCTIYSKEKYLEMKEKERNKSVDNMFGCY